MNSKTDSQQLQTESPIQQYYFRALICFAASGTLASFVNWEHPSPIHMGVIVFFTGVCVRHLSFYAQTNPGINVEDQSLAFPC